jgi:hypothetical protein
MDMRCAHPALGGIAAGLHRRNADKAIRSCRKVGIALEIWIEWRCVVIARMIVSACSVGLPELDTRASKRLSAPVEHAHAQFHDLSRGALRASGKARQVCIAFGGRIVRIVRPLGLVRRQGERLCLGMSAGRQRARADLCKSKTPG